MATDPFLSNTTSDRFDNKIETIWRKNIMLQSLLIVQLADFTKKPECWVNDFPSVQELWAEESTEIPSKYQLNESQL